MLGKIPFDTIAHQSMILQRLHEMRETKNHCDFVIKVGSEEFKAHRNILSAGSCYFAAMLSHDTKEKQTGIVEMKDVDPSSVIQCIDFIYTGKPPDLNDNIEQLMYTAQLFQLASLFDGIWNVLEKELSLKIIFVTMKIAKLYNHGNLIERCQLFILENLEPITELEEFGHLDINYIENIMKSENMAICSENKLNALLQWLKHNLEERRIFFITMLHHISLTELDAGYLSYLIKNEPLVNENLDVMKEFRAAVVTDMSIKAKSSEKFIRTDNIVVFDTISRSLKNFNPKKNKWSQLHDLSDNMRRNFFSAVCVENYIYIFFGDKSVYKLYYLDKDATWEHIGNTIENHGGRPPTVAFNKMIYVIGSSDWGGEAKTVEKYDTESNECVKLPDKPDASLVSEPVLLNDKIYCCCDFVNENWSSTVLCFDPVDLTWTNVAPMNEAKSEISAVAFNGKLYVLGGFNENYLRTVECYDVASNQWTLLKSMKFSRFIFQSFQIDDNIYAVGGNESSSYSIEKYNVSRNDWEDVNIPEGMGIEYSVKLKLNS